jgi:hypothetical protein
MHMSANDQAKLPGPPAGRTNSENQDGGRGQLQPFVSHSPRHLAANQTTTEPATCAK